MLAFDLYGTLVDPIAISTELAQRLGNTDSHDVARIWRSRQLEYCFRLTAMNCYEDFRRVTAHSLDDALAMLAVSLSQDEKDDLVALYDHLDAFPDAVSGLRALQESGHVLAVLSNGTPDMIENCLTNAGLRGFFTAVVSVHEVRLFKPSPSVYYHAAKELRCPITAVRLISANPFDVIGAKYAGMRTAWLNRHGAHFDTLGEPPDIEISNLAQLGDRLSTAT